MQTLAFRYMTRFHCITDRCEDTCCANWRIAVDRTGYERLASVLSADDVAHLEKNPDARDEKHHAFLKVLPSGDCHFLSEKFCSLHTKYGEDFLPNACAVYPRHVARVNDRVEIAGALSCPEVARLALLAPDAMDLVVLDEATAALLHKNRAPTRTLVASTPYEQAIDLVRLTIFDIVNYRDFSLAVRFTMLAHFADTVSEFLRHDAQTLDAAQLDRAVRMTQSPEAWSDIATQYDAQPFDGQAGFEFVASLLTTRLQLPHTARYAALVQSVAKIYQPADGSLASADVWQRHAERSRAVELHFGDRIDQYFRHYAMQFWLREWFTESTSLVRHALTFFVRAAAIRFLLIGHPGIAAVLHDDNAALDRVAVEVFQIFVRGVEHELELLKILEEAILADGDAFGRSLLLIKMFSVSP
jgi:lysine-N-methylase